MSLTGSSVGLTPLRKESVRLKVDQQKLHNLKCKKKKKEMEGKRQKTVHLKKYIIK